METEESDEKGDMWICIRGKTQPPDAKKIFSKALAANDPMVGGPDGPCGAGPCGHLQPGTMGQSKKQSNTLNGG